MVTSASSFAFIVGIFLPFHIVTVHASPWAQNGHKLPAITVYNRGTDSVPLVYVASVTEGILNLESEDKERAYVCAENCKKQSSCKAFDTCKDGLCALFDTITPIRGTKRKANCALYTLYDGECSSGSSSNPSGIRVSDGQALATHNSYRLAEPSVPAWNYDMMPIPQQLKAGVRGFEIDVQYDVDKDELHVFHVLNVDERAHHRRLRNYFLDMRLWSDANIGHFPLFIQIEMMGAFKVPEGSEIQDSGCATNDVADVLKCFVDKCEGKAFSRAESCLTTNCVTKLMTVPQQCLAVADCLKDAIRNADPASKVTSASAYATVDQCTVATGASPVSVPVTPTIAEKMKSRLVEMLRKSSPRRVSLHLTI